MNPGRVGLVAACVLTGSLMGGVLPAASASAASASAGNTATISAEPTVDSGFAGETLHFGSSARTFSVTSGPGGYVDVILGDAAHRADLAFTPPMGSPGLTGGRYDDDGASGSPQMATDLDVDGSGCRGRGITDVSDLARAADGTITRLALTFSRSCGNLSTVVGEIRYSEPVPDASLAAAPTRVDVGRQDPGYARTVPVQFTNTSPGPLTITGTRATAPFSVVSTTCPATLASGASCQVSTRFLPTAAGPVNSTLTVTDSTGGTHNAPLSGIGRAGSTALVLHSTPADPIGQNRSYDYRQANRGLLTFFTLSTSLMRLRVLTPDSPTTGEFWTVDITPPSGQALHAGQYFPTQRASFNTAPNGGLDVGGDGRGCNTSTGAVYVRTWDQTTDGRVLHADLQFRQLCDGTGTPLYGEVQYSAPAPISAIDQHYAAVGGASLLGLPRGPEHAVTGGRAVTDELGVVTTSASTATHAVHGLINTKYTGYAGVLGLPTTDETGTPDRVGRYNHFVVGSIYWTPSLGAHEVQGAIRSRWASLGWERSRLGYPTSDERAVPGGRASSFQQGTITWTASTGATAVSYR